MAVRARKSKSDYGSVYKGHEGQWSWILHRITGVAVILFLFAHIVDTSLVGWGPEAYDRVTKAYDNPIVRLLELGLVAAVLYHSFNGLKITLIDFFPRLVTHIRLIGRATDRVVRAGHDPRDVDHARSDPRSAVRPGGLMATTTERSTPASPPREPRIPKIGRDRPVGGVELWLWLFMRISGIVLILLAVGHVLIMHIPDGGVSRIDFGFVQTRWQSPLWRTWDWMLLSLALVHGVNGLRNITLDYVRPAGVRFSINMVFYVLAFALFVLGSVVVFTFDPNAWPPAG